jgi:hypothetical protein
MQLIRPLATRTGLCATARKQQSMLSKHLSHSAGLDNAMDPLRSRNVFDGWLSDHHSDSTRPQHMAHTSEEQLKHADNICQASLGIQHQNTALVALGSRAVVGCSRPEPDGAGIEQYSKISS